MAIATTIEQSRRLIKWGLDLKTADMYYYHGYEDEPNVIHEFTLIDEDDIRAWSLTALLKVMPKELDIVLVKTPVGGKYFFAYWTDDNHMTDDFDNPIDAAVEVVCKLLEQGYIEKGGVTMAKMMTMPADEREVRLKREREAWQEKHPKPWYLITNKQQYPKKTT